MGLFSKAKGFVGGITGATAAKQAKRAGRQQAQAYIRTIAPQVAAAQRAREEVSRAEAQARPMFDPYRRAGIRALGGIETLAARPGVYEAPTAAEVAASPAVRFRMQEAQRAFERGAAARGGLFGGGAVRGMTRYAQELASQEYEAEAARRFRQAQLEEEQRRASLSALAGLGQMGYGAAGQAAGLRERLGAARAGIETGVGAARAGAIGAAGQARASGALGAAQARQAGLGSLMQLGGTLGAAYMTGGGSLLGGGLGGLAGGGAGVPAGGQAVMPTAPAPTGYLGYQPSILAG